jgi:hypothetical protein
MKDSAWPHPLKNLVAWMGVGLGIVELVAPRTVTSALGVEGNENLIRAYGARELGTGILLLSGNEEAGLWGRIAGDGLNLALFVAAMRPSNPKRGVAALSLVALAGLTLCDLVEAKAVIGEAHRLRGRSQEA